MAKSILVIAFAIVALLTSCSGGKEKKTTDLTASDDGLTGSLQLSGAFALYPMAVRWAEEFQQLHPGVRIDISGGGAGKGMTDALAGVVDIGMVSREVYQEEIDKGAFPIAVVKDAVVITVNASNPVIGDILKKGISRETAERLWNKELSTWGQALGSDSKVPVHVFTRSDACGAAETFAAWFGKRQEGLKGTAVYGDPGVAAAVQKDNVGIGFNNIAYVYDQNTKKPFAGILPAPIDVNGNGVVDEAEDFYDTTQSLILAIREGRYPSPPARDLYMVTKGKPEDVALVAFLRYALTEGQKFAAETGYIDLSENQLAGELAKLE